MQDNLSVHSSMTKGKPVTVGQAAIIHHLFHRSKKKHATIAREVAGIRDVRTVARVLKQDPESYVPRAFHGRAERHDVNLRRDLIVRLVGEELTLEPDSDTDDDEPIVVGKKFATLRRLHAELRRLGHGGARCTSTRHHLPRAAKRWHEHQEVARGARRGGEAAQAARDEKSALLRRNLSEHQRQHLPLRAECIAQPNAFPCSSH
jgi:hypothetical protein